MKPILITINNIVSILSVKSTEAVHKYWAEKQSQMAEQGIEDSVIEASYNAFLNVLNNYWVLNQQDSFINDLPEELNKPSVEEFAFEYVDGKPVCLFVSRVSSEEHPYLFNSIISSESDELDQAAFENQSPE